MNTGSCWCGRAFVPCCSRCFRLARPAAVGRGDRTGMHELAAQRAGTATVNLCCYALYDGPGATCYGGALVRADTGDAADLRGQATEPFRNDRIDEVGNAALATGLLSAHRRVIWVDVHAKEMTTLPEAERPQFTLPEYRRGDRDRTNTGFPTIDAFPPMLWAGSCSSPWPCCSPWLAAAGYPLIAEPLRCSCSPPRW